MEDRTNAELAAASFRAACDAGAALYRGDFAAVLEAIERYDAGA
jgi:hypothetical protein